MTVRRSAPAPGSPGAAPVDASMNLINEVMRRPLDPGYQEAADRRGRTGSSAGRLQRPLLLLLAAALGLLTAAAAMDLRAPEPAVAQARALLEEQLADRRSVAEALLAVNQDTSKEITRLQSAAIGARDPDLLAQIEADGVAAGVVAVTGPGLRITLADSTVAADGLGGASTDERVQDVDLQIVVAGLWQARAEAIAINGQRLTAVTAIRSAGSAILVDLVPLTGPYEVEAIGDSARLATRFARTPAGQHLSTLRNVYGIGSEIQSADELVLAGSAGARLRSAAVLDGPPTPASDAATPTDVASSAPTSGGDDS